MSFDLNSHTHIYIYIYIHTEVTYVYVNGMENHQEFISGYQPVALEWSTCQASCRNMVPFLIIVKNLQTVGSGQNLVWKPFSGPDRKRKSDTWKPWMARSLYVSKNATPLHSPVFLEDVHGERENTFTITYTKVGDGHSHSVKQDLFWALLRIGRELSFIAISKHMVEWNRKNQKSHIRSQTSSRSTSPKKNQEITTPKVPKFRKITGEAPQAAAAGGHESWMWSPGALSRAKCGTGDG